MLNLDQQLALNLLESKENVFLTGPAGTGKSFLINHYRRLHPYTPVLSSTGTAAVLVGGRTFHSFFGLGTMQEKFPLILSKALSNTYLKKRIEKLEELIIDEISMLPGKALDLANLICKTVRGNDLPFGGVRVVAVGDFFQLPPVNLQGEEHDWAFKSFTWNECAFRGIELREFMRTKDLLFLEVLSKIRNGICDEEVKKFLNQHLLNPAENFVGTRVFARKQKSLEYNEASLKQIPEEEHVFLTEYTGVSADIEKLQRNLPIDDVITLKENALVMIRANDNSRHHLYVNGTLGYVQLIDKNDIIIKTLDGTILSLTRTTFELKDGDGQVLATATNFPLSLGYSFTIHKSQGCTIDKGVVDLSQLWQSGQCYTALSRLKSQDGLRILGWNKESIFVDPEVTEFYHQFRKK